MKSPALVITGIGLITPIGANISETRSGLLNGKANFQRHREIKGCEKKPLLAGYVDQEGLIRDIQPRILRKLDRFSLLSLQAFQQAISSSGLTDHPISDRGIFIGNSTGGWSFVEPQLHDLYNGVFDALSPYVATAWFPTAPQGEISIQRQISGYSKTFSAGSLSSAYAFAHACDLVQSCDLAGAFIGGVEAPLSPLVYNAALRSELVSLQGEYIPFHSCSSGCILGEGAGFISIEREDEESLKERNTAIARISGVGFGVSLSESIKHALKQADKTPSDISCIFLDAKGDKKQDLIEYEELSKVFSGCADVHLTTAKPLYGSLLSADFAVQAVLSTLCLADQTIPRGLWSKNEHIQPSFGRLVLDFPVQKSINNVLFYARELDGTSISVLLECY